MDNLNCSWNQGESWLSGECCLDGVKGELRATEKPHPFIPGKIQLDGVVTTQEPLRNVEQGANLSIGSSGEKNVGHIVITAEHIDHNRNEISYVYAFALAP